MPLSQKSKLHFDYARAGLEAFAREPDAAGSNPTLAEMRVRGVVSAARASNKPLTAAMRRVLEEGLSFKLMRLGDPGMIRDHVRATKRAAEELKGFLKEGSGVVAVGNSPEKVGFVLEAAGRVVTYPLLSRQWLQSSAGEAAKKRRFAELFAEALALIDPDTGPCTELVFVDYARTFSTFFALEAMLRKWHPEARAKSRFVAMFDRETDAAHLRTIELLPGWAAFEVAESVYMLAKNFRCGPKVEKDGGLTERRPYEDDACDAVRLLIAPDSFAGTRNADLRGATEGRRVPGRRPASCSAKRSPRSTSTTRARASRSSLASRSPRGATRRWRRCESGAS